MFARGMQGFNWTNEGKAGKSPKWGFVARNPGDNLTVEVPLEGVQTVNNELTIGLGFLVSLHGLPHSQRNRPSKCHKVKAYSAVPTW